MLNSSRSPATDAPAKAAENKTYRCYFTDGEDRIQSYVPIEGADDAQAALKAQEQLTATQFASAELWQGKRLVGKWRNARVANQRRQKSEDRNV